MPAYSITEYMTLPAPDTVWVWQGLVPTSGSALLFGNPKLGKSFLALGLAEAVADSNIDSFLGQRVMQHGRVLYVQMDTPRNLWKSNYLSIVKSGVARDNIFIADRELSDRPNPFDIRDIKCQQWIRDQVDTIKPVLTIIDTMRRIHRGDENDPTIAQLVFDTLINITCPSALMLLAHKKKQQHGEVGNGTARGSTAFTGAVDALINMTKTALHIEARSDVEEEINIYQHDDGSWRVNSKDTEIREFIESHEVPNAQLAKDLMVEYKVSLRTAQRWVKEYAPK